MDLLFWRKSEPALSAVALLDEPEVQTAMVVKEPVPVALAEDLTIPVDEFSEYRRIADKIGWKSDSVVEERFRHFFAENGMTVFPFEKVETFLDSEFGVAKDGAPTWYWRPLREKDMQAKLSMNDEHDGKNGQINNDAWYQMEVPLPVLMTIEKVHDEIPEACFYISESVEEGDPFLMVTAPGWVEVFVIERWNEPSFRM
jgi:hypothetical protein